MIRSFKVGGFKPFGAPVEVQLKPLTFFVGPNGSGKTSFFEAMALLAQTAGRDSSFIWDPKEGNSWVQLPGPAAILHKRNPQQELLLGISLASSDVTPSPGAEPLGQTLAYEVWTRSVNRFNEWKHVLDAQDLHLEMQQRLVAQMLGGASFKSSTTLNGSSQDNVMGSMNIVLSAGLLSNAPHDPSLWQRARAILDSMGNFLAQHFSYVGPERGPDLTNREVSGSVPSNVGKHGEHTLRKLAAVFASDQTATEAAAIRKWAKEFDLASLAAGWHGGNELTCDFRDPQTGTVVEFDFSGFGSAQLLPVIVELFSSKSASTIVVEEPEISLHPQAVAKLPVMLAEAVIAHRQVLVSTHSEGLLSDLHRAVGAGLPADQIAVVHFERKEGNVLVMTLPLTNEGFIEGWVPSFATAEDRSVEAWLQKVDGTAKGAPPRG